MSQSYWIAVDENGEETMHQYEPHYNHLHMKWLSNSKIHISKGLIRLLVNIDIEPIVKAVAYEIEVIRVDGKITPINIKKIYKDFGK